MIYYSKDFCLIVMAIKILSMWCLTDVFSAIICGDTRASFLLSSCCSALFSGVLPVVGIFEALYDALESENPHDR